MLAPPVAQRAERLEGVRRQPAGAVGHHRGELGEAEAEHDADRGEDREQRDRGAAERDERESDQADDQDRPGQADHERPPPVGLPGERAFLGAMLRTFAVLPCLG